MAFHNISEVKTKVGLRATVLKRYLQEAREGIAIKFTNLDIKALSARSITETWVYKLEEKEKSSSQQQTVQIPSDQLVRSYINTVVDDE